MTEQFWMDLSGGMNLTTGFLKLNDNEAELIINYHLEILGNLRKRPATRGVLNTPQAGKEVNGMFETSISSNILMVSNDSGDTQGIIRQSDGSANWSSSYATLTAGIKTRFVEFLSEVMFCNGTDAPLATTDLTTWNATTNIATSAPTGKYVEIYQDRIYIAGNSTNKSRLYFSSLPASGAISWDTTNDHVDINPDDNDEITALKTFGDTLLVFKKNALYRWRFGQVEPDRIIGVGTISQESVKVNFDTGVCIFVSRKGAYAYDGGSVRLISKKIQPFFEELDYASGNTDADIFAEVDNENYYLYLRKVSSDTLSVDINYNGVDRNFANVLFVYNFRLDAWTLWIMPVAFRWMARYDITVSTGSNNNVYYGGSDGRCYALVGGAIEAGGGQVKTELQTKEYLLSYDKEIDFKKIHAYTYLAAGGEISYRIDRNENFIQLGDIKSKRKTTYETREEHIGNTIQFLLTDSTIKESQIEGLGITYEHLGRSIKNG